MKFVFVTVKYLKDRFPEEQVYTDWEATLKSLGGNIIARNLEIGKTQTLHLHAVVGLYNNIFWNRLRGAPPHYHIDVQPIKNDLHMGRCINYMYKSGILSKDAISHHRDQMIWEKMNYAFIED